MPRIGIVSKSFTGNAAKLPVSKSYRVYVYNLRRESRKRPCSKSSLHSYQSFYRAKLLSHVITIHQLFAETPLEETSTTSYCDASREGLLDSSSGKRASMTRYKTLRAQLWLGGVVVATGRKYRVYRVALEKLKVKQLDVYRFKDHDELRLLTPDRRVVIVKLPKHREDMSAEEFIEYVKKALSAR